MTELRFDLDQRPDARLGVSPGPWISLHGRRGSPLIEHVGGDARGVLGFDAGRLKHTTLRNWTSASLDVVQARSVRCLGQLQFAQHPCYGSLWVGAMGWWLLLEFLAEPHVSLLHEGDVLEGLLSSDCAQTEALDWVSQILRQTLGWDLVVFYINSPLGFGKSLLVQGDRGLLPSALVDEEWHRSVDRSSAQIPWWFASDLAEPAISLLPETPAGWFVHDGWFSLPVRALADDIRQRMAAGGVRRFMAAPLVAANGKRFGTLMTLGKEPGWIGQPDRLEINRWIARIGERFFSQEGVGPMVPKHSWNQGWQRLGALGVACVRGNHVEVVGEVPEFFSHQAFNRLIHRAPEKMLWAGSSKDLLDSEHPVGSAGEGTVFVGHRLSRKAWDTWIVLFFHGLTLDEILREDGALPSQWWKGSSEEFLALDVKQQERLGHWLRSCTEEDLNLRQALSVSGPPSNDSELMDAVMRFVPDAFFLHDLEGVFLDCRESPEFSLMRAPSEFIGKHYRDILPKFLTELLDDAFAKLRQGMEPVVFEYTWEIAAIPRRFYAQLVRCKQDRVVSMVRDITQTARLRAEHELISVAIRAVKEGVVIARAQDDFPVVFVNEAFESITGYRSDEVLGKNLRMLQAGDHQPEVRAVIRETLRKGDSCQVVLRNYKKNGCLYFLDLSLSPLRNQEGVITHFIGVQRDISELIRSSEALAWQRRLYQSVVDTQQEMVCRYLPDTTLTFVNDAYCRMFQQSAEHLVGKPLIKFVAPEGQEVFDKVLQEIVHTGQAKAVELPVILIDGSCHWHEWVNTPVRDEHGVLREIQGVGRDITTRKRMEDDLRQRDERFQMLCENVPDLIFEFQLDDNQGITFSFLTRAVEWIWGIPLESLQANGELFLAGLSETDRQEWMGILHRSSREMIPFVFECHMQHAEGEVRWIRLSASPRKKNGQVVWFGYSADITDLKAKEESAMLAGKREVIERLAGGVAHDLNNYLGSILGAAEMLRERLQKRAEFSSLTETLVHEIQSAIAVTRQLLAFTKDQPVQLIGLEVSELLDEVVSFALRGSAVRTQLEFDRPGVMVRADRGLLQQVLFNLLLNAREAMEDKGLVRIRVEEVDEILGEGSRRVVKIHVMDSGPGIPVEMRQRIFEPYFTKKATGTGLGLYVVQTLLDKLGGSIEVAESAGAGAHLVITLPSQPLEQKPDADCELNNTLKSKTCRIRLGQSRADPDPASPLEVLLLEDTAALAMLTSEFLQERGARVETFSKGEDLLEVARTKRFKQNLAFVLDVTVPDALGGLDIASDLRKMHPQARIVLTSGYSDRWKEWREKFEPLRIDFLPKPFSMEALGDLVFRGRR